uniref:Uncharacterized protein n=1 Tax=uncultured marine virus TaxID=186617 RepID=A0A0F7L810_9VIRU|nr:hypothetical protein [uncultured marine virus]
MSLFQLLIFFLAPSYHLYRAECIVVLQFLYRQTKLLILHSLLCFLISPLSLLFEPSVLRIDTNRFL